MVLTTMDAFPRPNDQTKVTVNITTLINNETHYYLLLGSGANCDHVQTGA